MAPQKVWARFEAKQKDGSVVNVRIEDFPAERQEEVFDFMVAHYIGQDPLHVAAGIHKNNEAIKEYGDVLGEIYKDESKIKAVYCRLDNDDAKPEIIGFSIMTLENTGEDLKDVPKPAFKYKEVENYYALIGILEESVGESKETHDFYNDAGIMVNSKYHGFDIIKQFLNVRKFTCAEDNVPVTSGWMATSDEQKAAEANKWETIAEMSVEELSKKSGLSIQADVPSIKLMYVAK